jgi:glycosyltransferase 2 family protein
MKENLKNALSLFLRFGLSGALLWWLFSRIDFHQMWAAVQGADVGYLTAGGIVFFCINFVILWRWRILLKAVGLKTKVYSSLRWFFTGLFFNLFLPTSVGGDVIKGLGLSKETGGHKTKIFASIVLDRLMGFAGITSLAFAAFFFSHTILNDKSVFVAIVSMSAVFLVLGVLFFSERIFTFFCKAFAFWPAAKQGLLNMQQNILLLRRNKSKALQSIGISLVGQFALALQFYLIAKAMHQDIDLIYFIIFSPIVCVVTALPSIGGLGVREIGWVYLLAKVGVPEGVALGISLISFGYMVVTGLIGGLLYVTTLSAGRVQHTASSSDASPRVA